MAWRRGSGHLAWIVALGTIFAALVMAVTSRDFFPFAAVLLLLGAATLWLGYGRGWVALACLAALAADVLVAVLSLVPGSAARAGVAPVVGAAALLTLQFGLVSLYFCSFAWRALRHARDLGVLEVLQSLAMLGVGLGGSLALVRATGAFGLLVESVILALALGSYAASFTFIDRQLGSRRNFLFYSTVALALTVVALHTLLSGTARSLTLALESLGTAWIGSRKQRATLSGHGASFIVAASAEAGLLQGALTAFFGAVLILGGAKLLLEDLRHGRPAKVFVSLVLYGSALILTPRLARLSGLRGVGRDTTTTPPRGPQA